MQVFKWFGTVGDEGYFSEGTNFRFPAWGVHVFNITIIIIIIIIIT